MDKTNSSKKNTMEKIRLLSFVLMYLLSFSFFYHVLWYTSQVKLLLLNVKGQCSQVNIYPIDMLNHLNLAEDHREQNSAEIKTYRQHSLSAIHHFIN